MEIHPKHQIASITTSASKKHVGEYAQQRNHPKQWATHMEKHGAHQEDSTKPSDANSRHMPVL